LAYVKKPNHPNTDYFKHVRQKYQQIKEMQSKVLEDQMMLQIQ